MSSCRGAVCGWRLAPYARAYQAMRGVQLDVASTVAGGLGDMSQFERGGQLAAYVGLQSPGALQRWESPPRGDREDR